MTNAVDFTNYPTRFTHADGKVYLQELAGMPCGGDDKGMNFGCGFIHLTTNLGQSCWFDFELEDHSITRDRMNVVMRHAPTKLHVESTWTHDAPSGVWSRKDTVRNDSDKPITLFRCLSSLDFPAARYEAYSQSSFWCNENQGKWRELSHGSLVLAGENGRTTQGGTPYACLRDLDTRRGLAMHVIPQGNWVIKFTRKTSANSQPLVVEAGLADGDLRLTLAPGETLELPEILLQPLGEGPVEQVAPAMHSYLLRNHLPPDERDIPFVYNTWFDQFDHLDVERLRRQLAAAKDVGCEVFMIDAGWYGHGDKDWGQVTGDWSEATTRSFYGKMSDFAEEVRAAGLGFGIWMEPERFADGVPILREHPEWFIKSIAGQHFPNLETPDVYAYTLGEISRLVETYKLAWMKIDFNHPVGPDPTGKESRGYYEAWYRMLDALREKFPRTIFEGCASGGLRTDINTVARFPLHFQSDSIEPIDMLRISEGAMLRLTPGKLGKWIGPRDIVKTAPEYGQASNSKPTNVLVAGGALWTGARVWDVRFVAAVALCGVPGVTGDLSNLTPETRDALREIAAFYKTHRRFIVRCSGYLLTPPRPIEDRASWSAVQLQPPDEEQSLLLAYRLQDLRGDMRFRLRNLQSDRTYLAVSWTPTVTPPREITGKELMERGFHVTLPGVNRAEIFVIQPI
ncbi:MAG: alpha-galactosidase [Phycisphaerae bacterium]|nr:alpha-galactosidase [Phycisphaerae bacterium]